MIGWRIEENIDGNDVICEIVGQIIVEDMRFGIPVYHDNHITIVWHDGYDKIKVVERK